MSECWAIAGATPGETEELAAWLALVLKPGDLVALRGDLGAGKTTFARFLISHIAGAQDEEIPSPSFALAQNYETARYPVTHLDCYRLTSEEEAEELGLDHSLEAGPVLVEWPERIEGLLPPDRLEIAFSDEPGEETRNLVVTGIGEWAPRLDRLKAMRRFTADAGWGDASASYLQGDASPRAYTRLTMDGKQALLMDCPRMPDGPPVRNGKPYSAIAHLAEDVRPFSAVGAALHGLGLSTPKLLKHDYDQGFLLIEDLGDRVYGVEIASGGDAEELYTAAADVLVMLRQFKVPEHFDIPGAGQYSLQAYDRQALQIEVELLLDWFWPLAKGAPVQETLRGEFLACWLPLFKHVQEAPAGLVLRDFHSPNLIWLPERDGIRRVGIIDFQDALKGHPAYDLVSLCQDARRDVSEALEGALFEHYCAGAGAADASFDRDQFGAAYAILGAQRSTKILGIFARLAMRDGKRGYLGHIPRVSAYLERDLAHPALEQLRGWFDAHLPAAIRETCGQGGVT